MRRLVLLLAMLAFVAGAGSIDLTAASAHPGPGCELRWSSYSYCCDAWGSWTYVTVWYWECHGP